MASSPNPVKNLQYPPSSVERADRALRCSPFRLKLFVDMRYQSVPLPQIAGTSGVEKGYTKRPLSELNADNDLVWLIQVGLLRREVDGQGITDSFRLTPLGRQLVARWEARGGTLPSSSWTERLQNFATRWLRSPV